MNRHRVTVFLIVGGLLLFSLSASAQTRTGQILGQVIGAVGTPMEGVTITASSETLMGGSRTAITGHTGAYRFAALPPGIYSVTASMEGHQPQTMEDVSVGLGTNATADFTLTPEFVDEMVITGQSPLVDTTSSSLAANYSNEFLKDLPTQRNWYDIIAVAPDVTAASQDSDRMIVGGSNMQSNNWFLDGIETTAPESGSVWVHVNPDTIQEVQVMHIGSPAEYGNMLGAAMNVVTKSGSNQFRGGVNAYWFDNSLVDSDIYLEDSDYPEYDQIEFSNVAATLGGPIVKDRLWFFAAYEYWRDNYVYPGQDANFSPGFSTDRYDFKLTWGINQNNLVDLKYYTDDWSFPSASSQWVTPSATQGEIGDTQAWALNYQSIFSDRTFLEARYTGWTSDDVFLSGTGSTEAAYFDLSPPGGGPALYWGGALWPWDYVTSNDQVSVSLTHYADDWVAGDHGFKFGIQASRGDAAATVTISATGSYYYHYTYVYDYDGTTYTYEDYYRVDGLPYVYGNDQKAISAFVDDSWQLSGRLTLNLGLRYDYHRGIYPSLPRLDANGDPTGEIIPGIDPLFTWNNISPRIGFAYALGAEHKTVFRGSFGVYYDGNVGGNWNGPPIDHPGQFGYWGESWDGPWDDEPAWEWSPGAEVAVQPNLRAPRTLQYAIGFEHAFADNYSFGITGLYKDTIDLIGWQILDDGVYEEIEWTDPFTGDQYILLDPIVFPSTRKGNTPGFTVDPDADSYWQEYWGVILTFNRRFTDFWSMSASYTYSESIGLIAAFQDQSQSNPLYGNTWGADPNAFLNADGQLLQGDRPHMFRVQANFQLPWQMRANTMVNLQSGRPYNRLFRVPTERRPRALVVPAGDPGRHDFQYLWDIGIGKQFSLGGGVALQVDLQLINALNSTAVDWFETTTLFEGDDYVPNTWVRPRRLMLHLGIEF